MHVSGMLVPPCVIAASTSEGGGRIAMASCHAGERATMHVSGMLVPPCVIAASTSAYRFSQVITMISGRRPHSNGFMSCRGAGDDACQRHACAALRHSSFNVSVPLLASHYDDIRAAAA